MQVNNSTMVLIYADNFYEITTFAFYEGPIDEL